MVTLIELAKSAPPEFRFGDNKVYLAWLFRNGINKEEVVKGWETGALCLVRADLVMDIALTKESAVFRGSAEANYIKI